MVGEAHQVHPGGTRRGFPTSRLFVTVIPTAAVAKLTDRAELTDVVDQRAGIADGKPPGTVKTGQRVAGTTLVRINPIVDAKYLREVVLRVLFRAEAAVVLTRLHDN